MFLQTTTKKEFIKNIFNIFGKIIMLDSQNKKGENMKKKLLITLCLLLSLNSVTLASDIKPQPMDTEVKQKACQNVFSLINIDLSFMSPRAAVADVNVPEQKPIAGKNGVVPIANKKEIMPPPPANIMPPPPMQPKNKTSLFRIDLLGLFKIQIL